jgi:hypothetical protein
MFVQSNRYKFGSTHFFMSAERHVQVALNVIPALFLYWAYLLSSLGSGVALHRDLLFVPSVSSAFRTFSLFLTCSVSFPLYTWGGQRYYWSRDTTTVSGAPFLALPSHVATIMHTLQKEGQSQGRWWWKLARTECWDTVGIPKPSVGVATGW